MFVIRVLPNICWYVYLPTRYLPMYLTYHNCWIFIFCLRKLVQTSRYLHNLTYRILICVPTYQCFGSTLSDPGGSVFKLSLDPDPKHWYRYLSALPM